jgi:DNA repair ATPase RecN
MKIEDQVKQLTDLMADLIPTVDRLAQNQEKNEKSIGALTHAVGQLVGAHEKIIDTSKTTNHAISEMRVSNMRLAEAIEKLIVKIDKVDQFEERLVKLERNVFK